MKIVTGLFAQNDIMTAVHRLKENGFNDENISLMSAASQMPDYLEGEPEEAAATGAAAGAVTGSGLGALGTWVASTIPGFDAILATGLMTMAVGGVVGGYLGSLYSVRAESDTKINIHEELEAGKVLLLVKVDRNVQDREKMAVNLMEESNGNHVESHDIPAVKVEQNE